MAKERIYMCFDLKSFFASVECVERGLDPFEAKLIVADPSRGDRTICLAASPGIKKLGVRSRCRVYEIPKGIEYIMAPPRMQLYIDYSARIYGIYLKYAAKEDIHIYSIDEIFMDATDYMGARGLSPLDFARTVMRDVLETTGVTATCGIGTNLYLAKIALDVISKRSPEFIGVLDEESYKRQLWDHLPLTDFWRINVGTVNRLLHIGVRTMGELAHTDEALLYKTFGVDAQLLIDHAWGRESATIADIKAYAPRSSSLSTGQVLHEGHDRAGAKLLIMEMAELLSLELVKAGCAADSVELILGYSFKAGVKAAHGSIPLERPTSSTKKLLEYTAALYDRLAVRDEPVYRLTVCFARLVDEQELQYDMFSTPQAQEKEKRLQNAVIDIKKKYGKNGIFKGMNLLEGATTLERNRQIGGHRA